MLATGRRHVNAARSLFMPLLVSLKRRGNANDAAIMPDVVQKLYLQQMYQATGKIPNERHVGSVRFNLFPLEG
jgi:hypothetical protein